MLRAGPVFAAMIVAVSWPCFGGSGAPPERGETGPPVSEESAESERGGAKSRKTPREGVSRAEFRARYPWNLSVAKWPDVVELVRHYEPPPGFERVRVDGGSWEEFLRRLPVRLDRQTVRAHDGAAVRVPAAAVVALPVGDRNLQQCADSIIRLRAEYLWEAGRREAISFHFTSGDRSSWEDWAAGERFVVDGSEVERVSRGEPDGSRSNFLRYLFHLYRYAGTRSLAYDSRNVGPREQLRPGDFFVDPGSPGHVVLVLDVATNADGERIGLIGQGFMPAQEFHVVENPGGYRGPWFELPETGERLRTPSWEAFPRAEARRF